MEDAVSFLAWKNENVLQTALDNGPKTVTQSDKYAPAFRQVKASFLSRWRGRVFGPLALLFLAGLSLGGFAWAETVLPHISYRGSRLDTVKFEDRLGKHVVITSRLKAKENGRGGGGDYIFAYDYILKDRGYLLNWKLEDGVDDCDLDYFAEFAAKPVITDLDGNGLKEVTLVYGLTCRGDVSPNEYKVIMREGQKKYALRGMDFPTYLENNTPPENPCCAKQDSGEMKDDGKYYSESDFESAPAAFLKHARKLWVRYRSHFWKSES